MEVVIEEEEKEKEKEEEEEEEDMMFRWHCILPAYRLCQ